MSEVPVVYTSGFQPSGHQGLVPPRAFFLRTSGALFHVLPGSHCVHGWASLACMDWFLAGFEPVPIHDLRFGDPWSTQLIISCLCTNVTT